MIAGRLRSAGRPAPQVRAESADRWTTFRIEVLEACLGRPRVAGDVLRAAGVSPECPSGSRVAWRNLARLVSGGLLERVGASVRRTRDGGSIPVGGRYRTTPRGRRALADLRLLDVLAEQAEARMAEAAGIGRPARACQERRSA